MLPKLLAKTWPLTVAAAAAGFFSTILLVHLIGVTDFANYAIDLAKLSLFLLFLELVPSSFIIFKQQQDASIAADIPSFILLSLVVVPLGIAVGGHLGFFSHFSLFIAAYSIGAVMQRYFDSRLQAQGRINAFFVLPLTSNLVRLASLLIASQLPAFASSSDLAWGTATLGILCSQVILFSTRPSELRPFAHTRHIEALTRLWSMRSQYFGYYPNIALKRLRDVAMPLICDVAVADRHEAGKYLLSFRGVDFAIGQLRVIETFLSNAGQRDALKAGRRKSLLLVAMLGQAASIVAGFLLVGQAGIDRSTVILVIASSFFVYPYVLELAARSDAYASFKPRRVSISLACFLAGILASLAVAASFTELTAPVLVAAPLLGQTLATLSYKIFK